MLPATDQDKESNAVALLRTTAEVRERARGLLARARAYESRWFRINDGAMDNVAELVAEVTVVRYPNLEIPYHSRWRHFNAGDIDRAGLLDQRLAGVSADERARAQIDLALVSVLLDAGAGPDWAYRERDAAQGTEHAFARSEGLAVASFHAFKRGLFSSDPNHKLRVDAAGLMALSAEQLGAAFQVRPGNALAGLEERAALLRRLGAVLTARADVFGQIIGNGNGNGNGDAAPVPRPGALFDYLGGGPPVQAHSVLDVLIDALAPIWPAENVVEGVAMGDCWRHEAVRGPGASDGWMPFHALLQWLAYSLIEPLEWAGVKVAGIEALTGLPEYRNGGLLLDAGVLRPKDPRFAEKRWRVGDEFIVEWRALTVALLDELAPLVRERLGLAEAQLPLAKVLEGGTWAAGRVLANRLRRGLPPVKMISDGTVF